MTDTIILLLAGLCAGVLLAVCVYAPLLRRRNAELAAARTALRAAEQRGANQAHTIRQLQYNERIAAAQIVGLSYALADATAQVQGADARHGAGTIGANPLARFSLN